MTTQQAAQASRGRGAGIAGGVAAVVLAGVAGFVFLRPGAQPSPSPSPTIGSATPSPTPALNQELLSNRLTVLLLGLDTNEPRRARGSGTNSDTIMLASISADQSEVTLISVPRDTVDVPLADGTLWQQKINAIFSVNGPQGMVDAVESLLQVEIDAYVQIDMDDQRALVDAVDGVRVNPQAPLVNRALGLRMPAGRQVIDGDTALDYVRTRLDSDYARAARQQEVLLELVSRLVDPERDVDIPMLLESLFSFETDLDLADMPTFIEIAKRAQSAEVTDQVFNPQDGFVLQEGDVGDGRGYVIIPDIEAMRAFAAEHLAE
jgi:LCP family protein required for cell wall assembly